MTAAGPRGPAALRRILEGRGPWAPPGFIAGFVVLELSVRITADTLLAIQTVMDQYPTKRLKDGEMGGCSASSSRR